MIANFDRTVYCRHLCAVSRIIALTVKPKVLDSADGEFINASFSIIIARHFQYTSRGWK